MRIVNENLLDRFRMTESCEWCRRRFPGQKVECNHVFTRGAGRLDIRINLTSLGGPWQCNCHNDYHAGVLTRFDLLVIVAVREGLMQDTIERVIYELRAWDKDKPLPARLKQYVEDGGNGKQPDQTDRIAF